jgi:hypothetical protein
VGTRNEQLTASEVAAYLRCSTRSAWRWTTQKPLP